MVTTYMKVRPKKTAIRTLKTPSKAGSFGRMASLNMKTRRLTKNHNRESRK